MIRFAKLAALIALAAAPADAGFSRHAPRCVPPPRCGPAMPALASRALPAPPSAYTGPGGAYVAPQGGPRAHEFFLQWLNSARAASGLGPVGWDPALAGWAAANNGQQHARGMNHHVMGPARRQNVGWGDLASVSAAWMASPPHQSALLDPSITRIGIAGSGYYWTFSAN